MLHHISCKVTSVRLLTTPTILHVLHVRVKMGLIKKAMVEVDTLVQVFRIHMDINHRHKTRTEVVMSRDISMTTLQASSPLNAVSTERNTHSDPRLVSSAHRIVLLFSGPTILQHGKERDVLATTRGYISVSTSHRMDAHHPGGAFEIWNALKLYPI